MTTTKELDAIWSAIEELRASYALAIGKATDTINAARKLIAEAREGMDALPVAKVRRPRKQGDNDNVSGEPVSERVRQRIGEVIDVIDEKLDEVVSGGKS